MEDYFFSEDNVNNMTLHFADTFDIDTDTMSRDTFLGMRKIMFDNMQAVFDKYGHRPLPPGYKKSDYISRMNKKSLENSITVYNQMVIKKRQQQQQQQQSQKQIYKQQKYMQQSHKQQQQQNYNNHQQSRPQNRPQQQSQSQNQSQKYPYGSHTNPQNSYMRGPELFNNVAQQNASLQQGPPKDFQAAANSSDYAMINDAPEGTFVNAFGEYGMPSPIETNNLGKKEGKQDLEMKLMMMQQNGGYANKQPINQQQNGGYTNNQQMGGNEFSYMNYGGNNQQQPQLTLEQQRAMNLDANGQPLINRINQTSNDLQYNSNMQNQQQQQQMQQSSQQSNFNYSFEGSNTSGGNNFDEAFKPINNNSNYESGDVNSNFDKLMNSRKNDINIPRGGFNPQQSPHLNNNQQSQQGYDFFFSTQNNKQ